MQVLGEMEVDSLLLEGGGTLNESALRAGIVNEIQVYVAPKIFGGRAKSPVEGQGVNLPEEAYRFQIVGIDPVGEDIRLRCLPRTE
jgi:diaminohydroxyphosphoribosylaminopyrimidine deaminase/5-amino-6-(5-phosphoribosylamino)uracil reductase